MSSTAAANIEDTRRPTRFAELGAALRRLDRLLEAAIARAEQAYGPLAATDGFRGLHVGADDAVRMLSRPPGEPLLWCGPQTPPSKGGSARVAWIKDTYGLDGFELDVVLLALAPEVDLRYERLYAFLQDDVTRRRPTVGLALDLFCVDAEDRLACRTRFDVDSRLLHESILEPLGESELLTQPLRLDPQIIEVLIGSDGLDRRVRRWCHWSASPGTGMPETLDTRTRTALQRLARGAPGQAPVHLVLAGPGGSGRLQVAEAFSAESHRTLLVLDLPRLLAEPGDEREHLAHAFRESWLRDAVLVVLGAEVVLGEDSQLRRRAFAAAVREHPGPCLVASTIRPRHAAELGADHLVELGIPPAAERRRLWLTALRTHQTAVVDSTLDELARFQLLPRQIDRAAAAAAAAAAWRDAGEPFAEPGGATRPDLLVCVRAQTGHDLAELAPRRQARRGWNDLILPVTEMDQLREICTRARHADLVLDNWGFGRLCDRGRGIAALFSGPPGTGKTMAAEIIAHELEADLFQVDLARVVSKYIGETEKNLDRIFRAAEHSNGVLFFDEADALFGKRSEVRDAHDRYANIEISYLLQRLEQYDGVAILATNLRGNLDEAFLRRLGFVVHFPFPDVESRQRLWSSVWPPDAPLDPDVEPSDLAQRFPLSGGSIRSAALAAAFAAAEAGSAIGRSQVLAAVGREYQKLGRTVSPAELRGDQTVTGA